MPTLPVPTFSGLQSERSKELLSSVPPALRQQLNEPDDDEYMWNYAAAPR
jgi:hypothetical protein